VVLAVGSLVISSIDNILRPLLVGKDTQMHPLLIFLSTIGGIAVFGVSGLSSGDHHGVLSTLWEIYESITNEKGPGYRVKGSGNKKGSKRMSLRSFRF